MPSSDTDITWSFEDSGLPDCWRLWISDLDPMMPNTTKTSLTLATPSLTAKKNYDFYKREVEMWEAVTETEPEKRGILLALALPDDHPHDLKNKVMGNQLGLEQLKGDQGVKNLVKFLDKIYKKDQFIELFEAYRKLERFKREKGESVEKYILDFDEHVINAEKLGMKYPDVILAFKLLEGSRTSEIEKQMIISAVDYKSDTADLKDRISNAMKKHSGELKSLGRSASDKISVEDAESMISENPEVFAALGVKKKVRKRSQSLTEATGGGTNPVKNGKRLSCFHCGSKDHLKPGCEDFRRYKEDLKKKKGADWIEDRKESREEKKDSKEEKKSWKQSEKKTLTLFSKKDDSSDSEVNFTVAWATASVSAENKSEKKHADKPGEESNDVDEKEEKIPGKNVFEKEKVSSLDHLIKLDEEGQCWILGDEAVVLLAEDCRKKGVLDTACTDDVCGKEWLEDYVGSLSTEEKKKVKRSAGWRTFRFGGGEKLQSVAEVVIPANFGDQPVLLKVDVVTSNLPLLISLNTQKLAGTILNMTTDEAVMAGSKLKLERSRSGHYCLDLGGAGGVCLVTYSLEREMDWGKALKKLHEQLAHPPHQRLKKFIISSGKWDEKMEDVLKKVEEKCKVLSCRLFPTRKRKPVIAFPRATQVGQVLTLDLKIRTKKGKKDILYLIDGFSRLTLGELIPNKKPGTVAEVITRRWVGGGYGVPATLHSDNGGEFTGKDLINIAANFNANVTTTAGRTPYQNGLNERNHFTTDRMMEMILEDNPELDEEMALYWACNAKNCLQMYSGFSSYQLVFGTNPPLPSNLVNGPEALEGKTTSEIFARQLTAMHAAREAHIKAEADLKLRKGLRHQVRSSGDFKNIGDVVFFKRMEDKGWRGPAKVVGVDGLNLLVKRSNQVYNVRYDDAVRAGDEFGGASDEKEEKGVDEEGESEPVGETQTTTVESEGTNTTQPGDESSVDNDGPRDHEDETALQSRPGEQAEDAGQHLPEQPTDQPHNKGGGGKVKSGMDVKIRLDDGSWWKARVLKRTAKATSKKYPEHWMVRGTNQMETEIDFRKIEWERGDDEAEALVTIIPWELHGRRDCVKAKEKELNLLTEFKVYEDIREDEVIEGYEDKILPCTWVLTEKEQNGKTITKARLCVMGNKEVDDDFRRDSPTASKLALRTVFLMASNNSWPVESLDAKSAFLQGEELSRLVYVRPPIEYSQGKSQIWKLRKSLYGLGDAPRSWYKRVDEVLTQLGMERLELDPAVYVLRSRGDMIAVLAVHVDDFVYTGNKKFFNQVIKKLKVTLVVGEPERRHFCYVGWEVTQDDKGDITVSQDSFLRQLEDVDTSGLRGLSKTSKVPPQYQKVFRSAVGSVNWLAGTTRPDLCFEVMEMSTKFGRASVSDVRQAARLIKKAKEQSMKVRFPKLGNSEDIVILAYGDGAFASLPDHVSSCGGRLILAVGDNGVSAPLGWGSNKISRIVRSPLAAETVAMMDVVDEAYFYKAFLEEVLGKEKVKLQLAVVTDSKSLEESVKGSSQMRDKRCLIDVSALRQGIEREEFTVVWQAGTEQLADPFTKQRASKDQLRDVIESGNCGIVFNRK